MNGADDARARALSGGAHVLAQRAFATVTPLDVARASMMPEADVRAAFPTMHDLGVAVLEHERASMRRVQADLAHLPDPAARLVEAFRLVGLNLSTDIVVRAGVRIAGESRDSFPERRLDPFGTWQTFVRSLLGELDAIGPRLVLDVDRATWVIVTAGLGAVQIVRAQDRWHEAAEIMGTTAADALVAVRGGRS